MTAGLAALVLCYHALSDDWGDELAVSPRVFAAQIASFVRRGFRPVSAADVLHVRGRVFHVTFDDAFRSVLRGLPSLQALNVPATVFACSSFASDGRPLDVPELAKTGRWHAKEMETMRWDELRQLVERGVEIGSHTATHGHLTRLSDRELNDELSGSRSHLEDELRRPCRFLAYPYGEEDSRVRTAARRAGYEAAFALPGRIHPLDQYALPRVGIWRKDGPVRVRAKTATTARRIAGSVIQARGRTVVERRAKTRLT